MADRVATACAVTTGVRPSLALMTGAPPFRRSPGHARELAGSAVRPVGIPARPRADPDCADLAQGRPGPSAARAMVRHSAVSAFRFGDRELTVAELLTST